MTTISRARVKPQPVAKKSRADIQGLRMVAVLLVVLDHLFGWPRGGFTGVDVFFVLSGFLITGGLLHTIERDGRISFSNFYRRRVRRIVPAATLTLVVTVVTAYFLFGTARFASTLVDAVCAFFFVSNWRFISQGTDYFNADEPVSPVRQYWSLSVEEQFYFVWPVVMFVITLLLARRSRHRVVVTGAVMASVVIASFGYAAYLAFTSPTVSYFSTLSRVWELGAGALVAIFIGTAERIPDRFRPFLAWTGLIAIGAGAFALTEDGVGMPAPWGLLPVGGAVLIIVAGVSGEHKFLGVLTNPVSRYVGDISYSLYLWHWPVIVFLGVIVQPSAAYYCGAVLLMFGLSVTAYELFEDPIRRSKWLETGSERSENVMLGKSRWRVRRIALPPAREKADHPLQITRRELISCAAIVATGALVLVFMGYRADADALRMQQNALLAGQRVIVEQNQDSDPVVRALSEKIAQAAVAEAWPDLRPTMDDAINGPQAPEEVFSCGGTGFPGDECAWGSATANRRIVVVGDSVAMTYVNPLRRLAEASGGKLSVQSQAMFGCSFADGNYENKSTKIMDACPARRNHAVDVINSVHPDVVVISHTTNQHKINGRTVSLDEWFSSIERMVAKIAGAGSKVLFLAAPPTDVDIASCYTKRSSPVQCASRIKREWLKTTQGEKNLAEKIGGVFVDSRDWFCTSNQVCPAFVGTTPTKLDRTHMTPEYGELIAPAIGESLARENIIIE
ncbi:acyltransferase family protein [Gordonia amicalis]|uniref:Acyltransferase family protein n=1 Tax=Gordonia amicalis TaxID=89053 RepID=A0ABU4DKN7_9ACTN|nr:acyltransferase family protein [Gordonia amicalis]MDV6309971.1 acyltransferase family protein [Gordonia amicalis]